MGFPFPGFLGVYTVLNESVGALLIGLGLLARISAVFGALSMAGAFYTSIRLGEEPLRAALYLVIFLALAVTGPGKYSLDFLLRSGKKEKS
jgi:putative oxidoreductase